VGLLEKIKMQAVRAAVLKRMRVGVAAPWVQAPVFTSGFRLFSSEAQGTYLDKHVVTDRVLSVVKKMQKVDTAKVCGFLPAMVRHTHACMKQCSTYACSSTLHGI
jgi:hypothetical protein